MTLFFVGLGIVPSLHATEEAKQAIRASSTIFVLSPDRVGLDIVESWNPGAKLVDCAQYYEGQELRPEVYRIISSELIKCSSRFSNTAFVVYGHPMFLVSAVEEAIQLAEAVDIKTVVVSGISSFDTILADLKVDLGYGAVLIDASLLLTGIMPLPSPLPILIFQISNLGSNFIERDCIDPQRLEATLKYLLNYYPSDHSCKLVCSARSVLEKGYIVDASLGSLSSVLQTSLIDRPTLYVPASG